MTIGKAPHRPDHGKKAADEHHQKHIQQDDRPLSNEQEHDRNLTELRRRQKDPDSYAAEEERGGSRPGVESRVKTANAAREARELEGNE
jgi:hypothetical protein